MMRQVRACGEIAEAPEHLVFGPGIEGRRGLVEHQDGAVPHIGAGDGHLLPLAARQFHAVLEAPPERLLVALRQTRDHAVRQSASRRILDARAVSRLGDQPDLDVLRRREGVAHEILQDQGDAAAQIVEREGAQVDAVDRDAPLGRIVEPRQELDDRGLAGAVLADERHHLPGPDREVEAADRPALGLGIAEADALEDGCPCGSVTGRAPGSSGERTAGTMSKKEKRSSR